MGTPVVDGGGGAGEPVGEAADVGTGTGAWPTAVVGWWLAGAWRGGAGGAGAGRRRARCNARWACLAAAHGPRSLVQRRLVQLPSGPRWCSTATSNASRHSKMSTTSSGTGTSAEGCWRWPVVVVGMASSPASLASGQPSTPAARCGCAEGPAAGWQHTDRRLTFDPGQVVPVMGRGCSTASLLPTRLPCPYLRPATGMGRSRRRHWPVAVDGAKFGTSMSVDAGGRVSTNQHRSASLSTSQDWRQYSLRNSRVESLDRATELVPTGSTSPVRRSRSPGHIGRSVGAPRGRSRSFKAPVRVPADGGPIDDRRTAMKDPFPAS